MNTFLCKCVKSNDSYYPCVIHTTRTLTRYDANDYPAAVKCGQGEDEQQCSNFCSTGGRTSKHSTSDTLLWTVLASAGGLLLVAATVVGVVLLWRRWKIVREPEEDVVLSLLRPTVNTDSTD